MCIRDRGEDKLERGLIQVLKRGHHRQAADELRNKSVLQQILWLDLAEDFALLAIFRSEHLGREADRGRPSARRDDLLKAGESSAADEQDAVSYTHLRAHET